MTCGCFACKLHRKMKRTMKNGSHQQKNRLIKELGELWLNTSEDLDYHQAIADGSWPTSVEILTHWLEKATVRKGIK